MAFNAQKCLHIAHPIAFPFWHVCEAEEKNSWRSFPALIIVEYMVVVIDKRNMFITTECIGDSIGVSCQVKAHQLSVAEINMKQTFLQLIVPVVKTNL